MTNRKTFSEFVRHCAEHGDAGLALVCGRLPPGEWTPSEARQHLNQQHARGLHKSLLNEAAKRYAAEDGYEELDPPVRDRPVGEMRIKSHDEMRAEGLAAVENIRAAGGHVTDAGTLVLPDDGEGEE